MTEPGFIPAAPCPKCGNPRISYHSCAFSPVVQMFCQKCGFEGKQFMCPTLKAMVDDWNSIDRSNMPQHEEKKEEKNSGVLQKLKEAIPIACHYPKP